MPVELFDDLQQSVVYTVTHSTFSSTWYCVGSVLASDCVSSACTEIVPVASVKNSVLMLDNRILRYIASRYRTVKSRQRTLAQASRNGVEQE